MPWSTTGQYTPDDIDHILDDLRSALRTQFGDDYDLGPGSPLMKFAESFVGIKSSVLQSDILEAMRQAMPGTASGQNLDNLLFISTRKIAARATGNINVVLKTALTTPPEADPFFDAESLVFIDTAGRQYENTAAVSVNGTLNLAIAVRAIGNGDEGNIGASEIVDVSFRSNTASSRWTTNVATFNNNAAFTGGIDEETDAEFLTRFRDELASRPTSSLDGIISAVSALNPDSVDGDENEDQYDSSADEHTLNGSTHTGTASEVIDATNTRIARKFTVPAKGKRFVQDVALKLASNTALVGTLNIQTDTAGAPSGTLAHARLEKTSVTPGGTTRVLVHFVKGAFLTGGTSTATTYWLVFTRTSGSGAFDGAIGGTAGDVKVYDGTWTNDANVNRLAVEVIHGIPPMGFRIYVDGLLANDIAQAIHDARAAAGYADGDVPGTAQDIADRDVEVRFQRPTLVPLYVDLTLETDSSATATADDVRDIVVEYIGGVNTKGVTKNGLGTGVRFTYYELISRLLDDTRITGATNVNVLKASKVDPPTGTVDIPAARGEKFTISSAANDIGVTLVSA